MDPRTYETQAPLIQQLPQMAQMPLLPQQLITSGTRKDCIRLRGLPYEAQVEHILEFLGEHAKNIVYQGVHMVYNAQVRAQFQYNIGIVPSASNGTYLIPFVTAIKLLGCPSQSVFTAIILTK